MKLFFLFKIFASIILILLTSNHINAQIPDCPDGFSQMSTTVQVGQSPTCTYTIFFCYKCVPFGPHYKLDSLNIVRIEPPSSFCTKPYGEVITAAYNKILDPNYIEDILCEVGDVPLCPDYENEFLVVVNSKICWRKVYDSLMVKVYYEECPNYNTECYRVYTYCWDAVNEVFIRTYADGPTIINGPPGCTDIEPSDPDQYNPVSVCFQVCTPCTEELCDEE